MFIGKYEIDGKEHFAIYYKCSEGYKAWNDDIYYNSACNLEKLDFKISGKTYNERKNNLEELAKDWQYNFCSLDWSYGELYTIQNWFYENAKRYGLVKVFHENGIC
jgi:hypothetical protein